MNNRPRKLTNWLSSYLDYTTNTEAPTVFNLWVGIWTIAGALRRKVWLDMGHFAWYPNFYLFLVAPPGIVSKSTTLSIGTGLLSQIKGVTFGPEAMTWQALTESLANARQDIPMGGTGLETAYLPMSCLSIAAGELGTLISPNNREMMDALTSLWDGKEGVWEKWTKTSGKDEIINPWLNIASCTTPAWLAQNFPEEMVGGGFTSRCIFVYAEEKRQLLAYPGLYHSKENRQLKKDLIADLRQIADLKGIYQLSPDALKFGTEWYESHYRNPPEGIDRDRFGGYIARKQTHIHKTAIVLAAAYKNSLVIDEQDLRQAAGLIDSIEAHMQKVFEAIGVEGAGRHLHLLLSILREEGKIPRDRLFHRVMRKLSIDEFDAAISAAAHAGVIAVQVEQGKPFIILKEERRRLENVVFNG